MYTEKKFKIQLALAALVAILIVSGCSTLPYQSQPDDIRAVADEIATYRLPEGYSEQFAVEMMGYQLISLTGPTPSCHIYLVQAPEDAQVDIADLQEQARSLRGTDRDRPKDIRVVEQRPVMIRGQEVTLLVGEGINSDNLPYREAHALFAGGNGPALVSIASPVSLWDWALVDEFLASLQ